MTWSKAPGDSRGGGRNRSPIITETRASMALRIDVVAGQPDQIALHFEPDDAHMRHPRRQAQHRRAGAAADVEHQLMRLGRHRGSEKDRVDRDPVAVLRLAQAHPAAEQAILGEGRLCCARFAHLAPSPAASSRARARPMILIGHHQPARNGADAAFDEAGMLVEHQALDPRP